MPLKQTPITATAIIVAAGNSRRMGNGINKQFLLLDQIPVLIHTLKKFDNAKTISNIIVVTRSEDILTVQDMVKEFKIKKVSDIIPGGNTRQESVHNGLKMIDNQSLVAIHDGARPFVSSQLIDNLVETANLFDAAAPGIVPKDTVKIVNSDNTVCDTPERNTLRLIQTPQVFKSDILKLSYIKAEESGFWGTDDCSVVENFGFTVKITDGESTNIKITTFDDLPAAEAIYEYLKDVKICV